MKSMIQQAREALSKTVSNKFRELARNLFLAAYRKEIVEVYKSINGKQESPNPSVKSRALGRRDTLAALDLDDPRFRL